MLFIFIKRNGFGMHGITLPSSSGDHRLLCSLTKIRRNNDRVGAVIMTG